jgi:hypothetical protein
MKESLQQALTDPVPIFCKSSVSFHHHQKLTDHSIRGTEHRPPYLQVCKEYGKKSTRKPEYLRSEQADSALALSSLTELTDQHAHRLTVAICSNLVNTRYQLPQYLRWASSWYFSLDSNLNNSVDTGEKKKKATSPMVSMSRLRPLTLTSCVEHVFVTREIRAVVILWSRCWWECSFGSWWGVVKKMWENGRVHRIDFIDGVHSHGIVLW